MVLIKMDAFVERIAETMDETDGTETSVFGGIGATLDQLLLNSARFLPTNSGFFAWDSVTPCVSMQKTYRSYSWKPPAASAKTMNAFSLPISLTAAWAF